MAITEQERLLYEGQLTEARAALHRVTVGGAEVSLSYSGESISYSAANAGELRTYIRELEAKLGYRARARARSRGVVFG